MTLLSLAKTIGQRGIRRFYPELTCARRRRGAWGVGCPNGAGKRHWMRAALGLIRADGQSRSTGFARKRGKARRVEPQMLRKLHGR